MIRPEAFSNGNGIKNKTLDFLFVEKKSFSFWFCFCIRIFGWKMMMIIIFCEFVFDKTDDQSALAHIYMPIAWNVFFRFEHIILSWVYYNVMHEWQTYQRILFINFNNENKTPQTTIGKASKHPPPLNEIKIQQFQ